MLLKNSDSYDIKNKRLIGGLHKMKQVLNQKSKRDGITLIALVITIIVLLILAGVCIAMLTGENGLLEKAKKGKHEQLKGEMKEQLLLAIQQLQIEKKGKATIENITEKWVDEKLKEYEGKISEDKLENGKKIIMRKSEIVSAYIIDENLKVTEVEYNGSIEFSYQVGEREGNKVKIIIHIQDKENGVAKIELPEREPQLMQGIKEEINLEYEVELGKEYKIKITTQEGETREQIIRIEKYYYNIVTTLSEGITIDNEVIQIAYNESYHAKLIEQGNYKLKTVIVKMGNEEVELNNTEGRIEIENVIGNIEIIATSKYVETNFETYLVDYWPLSDSLENRVNEQNSLVTYKGNSIQYENESIYLQSTALKTKENYNLPNNFTVFFKYKPTSAFVPKTLILGKQTNYVFYSQINGLWIENTQLVDICNGYNGVVSFSVDKVFQIGKSSSVGMTYDGQYYKIYCDGKLISQTTGYNQIEGPLYIGGGLYSGTNTAGYYWGYANGYYKDIKIYKAFSEEQMEYLK